MTMQQIVVEKSTKSYYSKKGKIFCLSKAIVAGIIMGFFERYYVKGFKPTDIQIDSLSLPYHIFLFSIGVLACLPSDIGKKDLKNKELWKTIITGQLTYVFVQDYTFFLSTLDPLPEFSFLYPHNLIIFGLPWWYWWYIPLLIYLYDKLGIINIKKTINKIKDKIKRIFGMTQDLLAPKIVN